MLGNIPHRLHCVIGHLHSFLLSNRWANNFADRGGNLIRPARVVVVVVIRRTTSTLASKRVVPSILVASATVSAAVATTIATTVAINAAIAVVAVPPSHHL